MKLTCKIGNLPQPILIPVSVTTVLVVVKWIFGKPIPWPPKLLLTLVPRKVNIGVKELNVVTTPPEIDTTVFVIKTDVTTILIEWETINSSDLDHLSTSIPKSLSQLLLNS